MATVVKCRLCKKRTTYKPDQINQLGEHLLRSHPKAELTHFSFEDDTGDGVRYFHGRNRNDEVFFEGMEELKGRDTTYGDINRRNNSRGGSGYINRENANNAFIESGYINKGNTNNGYTGSGYIKKGNTNNGYMNNGFINNGTFSKGDFTRADMKTGKVYKTTGVQSKI